MTEAGTIPEAGRRHVVLVAYYFPPLGGSGVQRVAKWAKYLPENGWDVTVLTVEPGAYFAFDESLLEEVESAGVRIVRTRTLDPTSAGGGKKIIGQPSERKRRFFTWLTGLFFLPDNKRGWRRHARRAFDGLQKTTPVDVVLSSAPPYTSLMVGDELAAHLSVPHIIDYRDDWVDNPRHRYPTMLHKQWHVRRERSIVERSALVMTINQSIAQLLRGRHPGADVEVLPQGYDPADFPRQEARAGTGRIRLVYAGMFYDAQQPDSMLHALSLLAHRDPNLADRLDVRFIGLFPDEKASLITSLGLEDLVSLMGYQTHAETVAQLNQADILWMVVGHQKGGHMISTGKLFEYMGTGRPILALAPEGEVRRALKGYGAAWTIDPDDSGQIATTLASLLKKAEDGSLPLGDTNWTARFDRKAQAAHLAAILDRISR